MEDDQLDFVLKEARNGNIDYVLNSLDQIINQFKKSNQHSTAIQVLLELSSIFLKNNNSQEASNLANYALDVFLSQSLTSVPQILIDFATSYPIENQSASMISFFLTIIRLSGDTDHSLRKKLISFSECNYKQRPDFIQKMYLMLYKEYFQTKSENELIISFDNLSIEKKEKLNLISINENIPFHFAQFLWSIMENTNKSFNNSNENNIENDSNSNENSNDNNFNHKYHSYQHTINAIFLRAILTVSLQSDNREAASSASRTLYEMIPLAKPDSVESSILDHPFYHFCNLITKMLVNYSKVPSNSFKSVVDSYEKILFQDSEIAILLSLISKKYFNLK